MTARAIESASTRIADLRGRTAEEGALAAGAFAAALLATQLAPRLAVPLLLGALWASYVAMRDFVRRQLLLEDLACDRDAQAIPAVRRLAQRSAAAEHRRLVAASIRAALEASSGRVARVEAHRELLEELAAALVDARLGLDPAAAVALDRLRLGGWDALYGSAPPADELGSRLRRILDGFAPLQTEEAPR